MAHRQMSVVHYCLACLLARILYCLVRAHLVPVSVSKADNKDGQSAGNQNAEQQQAANEKVKKAVEQLNRNMPHSEAVFGIHDGTNRVMIKIVDKDTKEVIKEFPPEETLDMIEKVWELAGIMVDERR